MMVAWTSTPAVKAFARQRVGGRKRVDGAAVRLLREALRRQPDQHEPILESSGRQKCVRVERLVVRHRRVGPCRAEILDQRIRLARARRRCPLSEDLRGETVGRVRHRPQGGVSVERHGGQAILGSGIEKHVEGLNPGDLHALIEAGRRPDRRRG